MDVRQLEESLKQDLRKPVYLVSGEEEALVQRCVQLVREGLRAKAGQKDFMTIQLEAKSLSADDLDMAARSQSLFGGARLVVVRDSHHAKTELQKKLTEYLQNPVPTTTLVLESRGVGTDTRDPKRSGGIKTLKELKKILEKADGAIVDCPKPRPGDLPRLVQQMLGDKGLKADREAFYAIVDAVGENIGGLIQAIEKISLYVAGQSDVVTKTMVEKLVSHTKSQSIFALTDAIGERSADKALKVLGDMLRDNENVLMILGQIARHWRTLASAQALHLRGRGPEEIRKALGLHPFVVKKSLQQARKFKPKDLTEGLIALSRTDTDLKSTRIPDRLVLEKLVLRLCGRV